MKKVIKVKLVKAKPQPKVDLTLKLVKEMEQMIKDLKKDLKFSLDSWDVQGFSHKGEMIRQKWGL
jgi:hypothetical protein